MVHFKIQWLEDIKVPVANHHCETIVKWKGDFKNVTKLYKEDVNTYVDDVRRLLIRVIESDPRNIFEIKNKSPLIFGTKEKSFSTKFSWKSPRFSTEGNKRSGQLSLYNAINAT